MATGASPADEHEPLPTPPWVVRRWGLLLGVLVLMSLGVGLSGILTDRPLETHEIFVAQTVREMHDGDNWAHPTFNAQPRLNKPPMQYWLVGALHAALNDDGRVAPWVARLPSLGAGVGLLLVTVSMGRRIYGRSAGLVAGALLGTSFAFFEYTNSARAEMLYALTTSAMLLCFIGGWNAADRSRAQLRWALGAWACFGLAILAKGPHVPALVAAGFLVGLGVRREFGRARWILRPLPGVPTALAIALPWVVSMVLATDGAAAHWAGQLFAGRSVDPGKGLFNWLSPYYLYAFPMLILPWAILVPFGVCVSWQRSPALRRGLVLFFPVAVTVLVMGLSNHRRDYYLLPVAAPMLVLCAAGTLDVLAKLARSRGAMGRGLARLTPAGAALALCAVSGAALMLAGRGRMPWSEDRWQYADFAEQVDRIVGDDLPVGVYRADPDALVYYIGRPVERFRQSEQILEAAGAAALWLVVPPGLVDDLPAGLRITEKARLDTRGSDHEGQVLVLVHKGPAEPPSRDG